MPFPMDISTTEILVGACGFLFIMVLVLAIGSRKKSPKLIKTWRAKIPAEYILEEEGR